MELEEAAAASEGDSEDLGASDHGDSDPAALEALQEEEQELRDMEDGLLGEPHSDYDPSETGS